MYKIKLSKFFSKELFFFLDCKEFSMILLICPGYNTIPYTYSVFYNLAPLKKKLL